MTDTPITPEAVERLAAQIEQTPRPDVSQRHHTTATLRALARELAEVKAGISSYQGIIECNNNIIDGLMVELATARAEAAAAWLAGRDAAVGVCYANFQAWLVTDIRALSLTDPADALAEHDRAVMADERAKCAEVARNFKRDWNTPWRDQLIAAILTRGEQEGGDEHPNLPPPNHVLT